LIDEPRYSPCPGKFEINGWTGYDLWANYSPGLQYILMNSVSIHLHICQFHYPNNKTHTFPAPSERKEDIINY